jgi:hypothetical protein
MRTVLLVSFLVLIVGCDSVQYNGDGKLIDNGAGAATDRYVLDLGIVSLRTPTSSMFKLTNLPKDNFVVGLALRSPDGLKLDQRAIAPVVAITLLEDGKLIFTKEGTLTDWTWSDDPLGDRVFVYGRRDPGTYFDALPNRTYELRFFTKQPDRGSLKYEASLVAKSGGWK